MTPFSKEGSAAVRCCASRVSLHRLDSLILSIRDPIHRHSQLAPSTARYRYRSEDSRTYSRYRTASAFGLAYQNTKTKHIKQIYILALSGLLGNLIPHPNSYRPGNDGNANNTHPSAAEPSSELKQPGDTTEQHRAITSASKHHH